MSFSSKISIYVAVIVILLSCLSYSQAQEPVFPFTSSTYPDPNPSFDHVPFALDALAYIAVRDNISQENLKITNSYEHHYETIGRRLQAFSFLDISQPDIAEYFLMIDLVTGEFVEDWQALERAEKNAYQQKYGKLRPALYERLQNLPEGITLPIAIWLAGGETETTPFLPLLISYDIIRSSAVLQPPH